MELALGLVFGVGVGLAMKAVHRRGMASSRESRGVWALLFLTVTVGLVFGVRTIGDYLQILDRDDRRVYMRATAAGIFLGLFAVAPLIWRRRDHRDRDSHTAPGRMRHKFAP